MPKHFLERISSLFDVLLSLVIMAVVIFGIVFVFPIIAIATIFKHVIIAFHEKKKENKKFEAYQKEIIAKIREDD